MAAAEDEAAALRRAVSRALPALVGQTHDDPAMEDDLEALALVIEPLVALAEPEADAPEALDPLDPLTEAPTHELDEPAWMVRGDEY